MDDADSSSSSSSDTESDDDKSEKGSKSRAKAKPKSSVPTPGGSGSKRKAPQSDDKSAAKRPKKDTPVAQPAPLGSISSPNAEAASLKSDDELAGNLQAGRIFNVKQLATIIEEYEKNPRPTVARLEELEKVLNQDDHTDELSVSATGVTKQQIKTWFSNRRAKERLDLIKMKIKETRGGVQATGSDTEDDEREDSESKPVAVLQAGHAANTIAGNVASGEKRTLVTDDDPDEAEDMKVDA